MSVSYDLRPIGATSLLRPARMDETKASLIGLSRAEMASALQEIGVPERQTRMRVSQLWHWLYVRGVSNFDDMFNISKDMREKMK